MEFIKVESQDLKIEETFSLKQEETEELIKVESEDVKIEETLSEKHKETEEQTGAGAKTGAENTSKGRRQKTKLPCQKDCHACKERIGVARKTCPHCGAKQLYKQKLEEKKKNLAQEWKDRQKNPSTVSKVYEATELLLHKWDLLERYPVLLLARKTNKGFSAECFCPWQMNSKETQDAFVTIKRQYESLLNVVIADKLACGTGKTPETDITQTEITPLQNVLSSVPESDTSMSSSSASLVPSSFHATQTPVVSCSTSLTPPVSLSIALPLSSRTHPDLISSQSSPVSLSLTSALPSAPTLSICSKLTPVSIEKVTPDSESSSHRKKRRKEDSCDCPTHKDSTSFPYKKILRKRVREGRAEVLVQWYPCSGCGAKWENSWEPRENIED